VDCKQTYQIHSKPNETAQIIAQNVRGMLENNNLVSNFIALSDGDYSVI
jgi:hypothetical protein